MSLRFYPVVIDSHDVGQGADARFVVLADPEGNEFCVLSARD
jgi:hypothetical protein